MYEHFCLFICNDVPYSPNVSQQFEGIRHDIVHMFVQCEIVLIQLAIHMFVQCEIVMIQLVSLIAL